MNQLDREFWNGSLKTVFMVEERINKLIGMAAKKEEKETIEKVLKEVQQIESGLKKLHTSGMKDALRRITSRYEPNDGW